MHRFVPSVECCEPRVAPSGGGLVAASLAPAVYTGVVDALVDAAATLYANMVNTFPSAP